MSRIIQGEKTYLRPFERGDLELYQRWRSDGRVAELTGFVTPGPLSMAQVEKRFEDLLAKQGTDQYTFMICRLEDDRGIGELLLFEVDRANGSVGLGIFIGESDLWGGGYGSDAVGAAADFAFGSLRMERLWLNVGTENPRAQRAYEKAGFVREGTLRHDRYEGGRYTDGHVMSILRDEWLARPRRAGRA